MSTPNTAPTNKTYGDRPRKFQMEEGGDFYYIGSEVCITVTFKNAINL